MPNRWAVIALIVLALILGVVVQTMRLNSTQTALTSERAAFSLFKEETRQLGEAAAKKSAEKEKEYAQTIANAVTDRNAALAKLRQSASSNPRGSDLSKPPSAAPGSSQVCLDPTAYTAALAGYRERLATILDRIGNLAGSCDEAQIDAESLISAWPR